MSGAERPVRLALMTGAQAWGGAEIVAGHLLSTFGDDVEPVVVGVDHDVVRRLADFRAGCERLVVPAIRDDRDLAAMRGVRAALRRLRPDLLQFNLPVPFAEPRALLAAATVPGLPTIAVHHLPMPIRSRRIKLLGITSAHAVTRHVAVGAFVASEVERMLHLRKGSVQVVPNGVPRPLPGPPPDRPVGARFVIGAVGRLDTQKGLDVLLRAAAELPDAQVVLVGDGPERPALERLARNLGIAGRLTITGWTPTPTTYLPAFDVLAMPSRLEGLPLALLEAMHAGRPVVASAVGSVPEAVHDGRTGLLVPAGDPAALAAALGRLERDPALRSRLGAAAADMAAKRFTVEAMAEGYRRVHADVLARRHSVRGLERSTRAGSRRRRLR